MAIPAGDAGATAASTVDTTNTAEATGGVGGDGGNGGNTYTPGQGGGRAGNGNVGGLATATATTTAPAATNSATATAFGGSGGGGGIGGSSPNAGGISLSGVGGPGGSASAQATDTNTAGTATATAVSTGGTGGASQYDVQMGGGGYVGNVYQGGAGGVAHDTTARAVGTTYATANVTQTGGSGGGGPSGGNGANSTLTNAVSGQTSGGTLGLTQTAQGGDGGRGGPYADGASGGDATSTLTIADTSSTTVSATSNAYGGDAGEDYLPGGFEPTGHAGNGSASASVSGAANQRVFVDAAAMGGGGTVGGTANANATGTGTSTTNVTASAEGGFSATREGNALANATGTGSSVTINATASGGIGGGIGGAATAIATGTAASGTVSATAGTAVYVNTSVSYAFPVATAAAAVSGHAVASALATEGGMLGAFDTSSQAVSTAVLNPTAAAYGTALPSTDTLLLETEEGGGSSATTTGTATATATFYDTYGLAALPAASEVMLDLHGATLVGQGVTSVTFAIDVGSGNGAYDDSETFTSGSQALAYFTNHVIDLGAAVGLSSGTNGVNISMILSVTTDAPSSGFYIDPVLGNTNPTCYCRDTLILTSCGERSVDALAIGDAVVTASGEHRPIKWIGRRSYAGRFLATNPNVHPIRFRAGSLGDGLPRRDLLVSPEHAMFLDDVLIPAKALVNGGTIVQERGLEQVDYFHIELDSHDVLLAEGAPLESFLEDGNRGQFHNAAEHAAMYPSAPAPGERCAPWVDSGVELEAIRRRLAAVAGKVALAA